MKSLEAIEKYGSFDKNDRKGLYYTLSLTPNSAGLFIDVTSDNVRICHKDGTIVVSWFLKDLEERFVEKIPVLIFVSVSVEVRDDVEYFHYYKARLMRGTSINTIAEEIKQGNILIDLRLHDKGTSALNHKTTTHSIGNYVNGNVHTNTIESFWSIFKRGYIGVYHYMSVKHLQRYINEYTFRYNNKDKSVSNIVF